MQMNSRLWDGHKLLQVIPYCLLVTIGHALLFLFANWMTSGEDPEGVQGCSCTPRFGLESTGGALGIFVNP